MIWPFITNYLDRLFLPIFLGGPIAAFVYWLRLPEQEAAYAWRSQWHLFFLMPRLGKILVAFYFLVVFLYPFSSPTFCKNVGCRSGGKPVIERLPNVGPK